MAEETKRAKDWRKSKAYTELKRSMEEKLQARGLAETVYTDKVAEYMDFWVRRKELQADIQERGLTVVDERGRMAENRSVSLEIQASKQMLAIFTALGFKQEVEKGGAGGADDDEL